jgi:hypothetical protein
MKTLRQEYTELQDKIFNRYQELVSKSDYNFTNKIISEYEEHERESVKNLLEDEDFNELYDYDFQEFLEQIFYNNRRGNEVMGYLLSVSKEVGIYILDNEASNTFHISFSDLNGLDSKLTVIEEIENI